MSRKIKSLLSAFGVLVALWWGMAMASPAGTAAPETPPLKALLLIAAFIVGLVVAVWIAASLMGPEVPADDEGPFLPIGIGDEEDEDEDEEA